MENGDLKNRRIIFFDGNCHLCNGFVDALILRNKKHVLFFAPLQGETAKSLLSVQDRNSLDTVVYFEAGQVLHRSTAVLRILTSLGGVCYLAGVGYLVPTFLRDLVYKWVAKNRYAWFGKREFCRTPLPEERPYLLL